jgi:protein-tyrosine kinase
MEIELLPTEGSAANANQALILAQVAHGFLPKTIQVSDEAYEVLNDVNRVIENVRSMAKLKGVQVIGIAGAVPNEGTSILGTMISLMMAGAPNDYVDAVTAESSEGHSCLIIPHRNRHGILLIDAQWQRPSLHKIFGVTIERGLSELLSGEISTQIALKNIPIADLKLITAGQIERVSFNKYFYLDKLKALLNDIKSDFEFVFLDIPSLLHSAEGIALSKLCDGLILVVRAEHTRWEVVEEARRLLEKSNVNILGAVLNRRNFYIPKEIYQRL